jgi:serine phosphatase RsbU (regulator of sigma subunit)
MLLPSKSVLRILLLEDSALDAELIQGEMALSGVRADWSQVHTRADFESAIHTFRPNIIFADYRLPTFDGSEALAIAREICPEIPVLIISGIVGEETAVELLKRGATDFVLKDRLGRLGPAVQRALREVEERRARHLAERELRRMNEELELRVAERTRELTDKNAQMEEQLQMARELQMALLPHHFPTLPRNAGSGDSAVRFCSMYQPTHTVGGDFFNVVPLSDTSVGVFMCDVMGHGVRAALVTAMMRAFGEQFSGTAANPGELLAKINRTLWEILRQSGTNLYATASYVIADVAASRITFANAGHPSPLLVRNSPILVEPIVPHRGGGPALGLFENAEYQVHSRALQANDLILFFTDGLFDVENHRDESFNEQRLRESIQTRAGMPPAQLVNDVFEEIERFAEGRAFADDVCFLGMEIAHLPSSTAA